LRAGGGEPLDSSAGSEADLQRAVAESDREQRDPSVVGRGGLGDP
jgi:hypothetical protein